MRLLILLRLCCTGLMLVLLCAAVNLSPASDVAELVAIALLLCVNGQRSVFSEWRYGQPSGAGVQPEWKDIGQPKLICPKPSKTTKYQPSFCVNSFAGDK
jgi:hypothetical protein